MGTAIAAPEQVNEYVGLDSALDAVHDELGAAIIAVEEVAVTSSSAAPTVKAMQAAKACCTTCRLLDIPGTASIRFPGGMMIILPDGTKINEDDLAAAIKVAAKHE